MPRLGLLGASGGGLKATYAKLQDDKIPAYPLLHPVRLADVTLI